MRRSKPLQRNRRKSQPLDAGLARRYWKMSVTRGGCVMCRAYPLTRDARALHFADLRVIEGHHILAQRHLKGRGFGGRLWDTRNGIGLCRYHHPRHESAMQRVPLELIPDDALEFAIELDLDWIIEREYPRAD